MLWWCNIYTCTLGLYGAYASILSRLVHYIATALYSDKP